MKVKSLAIAVGTLGLLTTAVWFFQRDTAGPAEDPRIGQPILDKALLARIGGLHLHTGGNSVTITGIDLAADQGGVVSEYHDLPVDFGKLVRLLDDLQKDETKVTRLIGSNPERLAKLGFAGDRIELRDKSGATLWTLHLGSTPPNGGRFVKFGDENKAYLATFSAWLDGTPKNWANAALVGAKADDVVGIEARFADGTSLTATRVDAKGVWRAPGLAEGETLRESELNSLVSRLATLRFMDTREPETLETIAARPTARTYVLTLTDDRTITITASQRQDPPPASESAEDGAAPATPQNQPADVFVQSSRADDRINALMTRRSFQVADWTFNGLPAERSGLVNAPPAAAPTPSDAAAEEPAGAAAAPTDAAPTP